MSPIRPLTWSTSPFASTEVDVSDWVHICVYVLLAKSISRTVGWESCRKLKVAAGRTGNGNSGSLIGGSFLAAVILFHNFEAAW